MKVRRPLFHVIRHGFLHFIGKLTFSCFLYYDGYNEKLRNKR